MKKLKATVVSVHTGDSKNLGKESRGSIIAELDGFVGDAHKGYTRKCWSGDKQAKGMTRRNERQWSAVSVEELEQISTEMGLSRAISPETVGANLCLRGIDNLSRLPKGTLLNFPSGAVLVVVEYNPPCQDMGKKIARDYTSVSGAEISPTGFSKAAKLKRGLVGVIDAAGVINAGDELEVVVYEHPGWLG